MINYKVIHPNDRRYSVKFSEAIQTDANIQAPFKETKQYPGR